jgi:hypothetical protein
MPILRCFVVGCRVYTQFEGGTVIVDEFEDFERAMQEREALIYFSAQLHGSWKGQVA